MVKTFCVKTLGCKVNTYESEFIISLFLNSGYDISENNADVYVINTCTVTNESDKKSKKLINSIRRNNKDSILIVVGCYPQYLFNSDEKINIDADIIIGNQNKSKIITYLEKFIQYKKQIIDLRNINNLSFEDMEVKMMHCHTRAFIKIQDGCNNFCSYCIIPYVRGDVRSKSKEKVLDEAKNLVKNGYKEIVLTGIHTGQYGINTNYNLFHLLLDLIEIENLERIRISSIEINELTEEIISLLSHPKIAAHLHLPLQSGSDKILKLMNRKYDTIEYENKIKMIRKINPSISISTDLIVGFPFEDEKEFNNTLEFCKKMKFSKIHVFPYSQRNGTESSKMGNKVDIFILKSRVHKIIELSDNLNLQYNNLFNKKYLEVLIERKKGKYYYGYSSNYIEVKIKGNYKINNIYKIKYKC